MGYRGLDLSYFFIMAGVSFPLRGRRAFAQAYLEAHGNDPTEEDISWFLWDLERCIPLGLISAAAWWATHGVMAAPHVSPLFCSLAERTLVLIERAADDRAARDKIVRRGVANLAMGWGIHPVDHGCFPLY